MAACCAILAGVLALAAEFKPDGVDLVALANQLAKLRDRYRYTSTQEDSWTLLAAAAVGASSTDGSITLDGEALTGQVYRSYEQQGFAPVEIANTGTAATEAKVTVTGYPAEAPAESSNGFTIYRDYYLPDGTPGRSARLHPIAQNERLVVVLTVRPQTLGSGQYVVADPLPAGFEIENPNLSAGDGVSDFSWLQLDSASACGIAHRPVCRGLPLLFGQPAPSPPPIWCAPCRPARSCCPAPRWKTCIAPNSGRILGAASIEVTPTGP